MIKHSNGYIEEYLKEIESNKIIAGNEILQILHNLISDMESDAFVYDTTDADRRMGFIEGCLRLTKSPFYQKPFKLMLWQKAFISALYGFYMVEDGTQRFRKACLLIARKNGKSELCSALLLTDFFIGGKGMDIVCSSNDDTQASILFDACDTMRQLIDPMSEDTWRNQKGLKCFINNNKIFKISERTRNREGRNIDTSVFDECFPPDVEILTHRGYIRFDELKDTDLVAEVNDSTFDFVKPVRIIKREHEGELIGTTIGLNAKLFTTLNHNMVYMNTKTNKYEFVKAIDIPEKHHKLVKSINYTKHGEGLTDLERIFIATQADGTLHYSQRQARNTWHNSRVSTGDMYLISFKKQRKIDRFIFLCERAGINYKEIKSYKNKRRFTYILPSGKNYKHFDETFNLNDFTYEKAKDFIDELVQWDGSVFPSYLYYSSVVKKNADFVTAIGTMAGYNVRCSVEYDNRKSTFSNVYRVTFKHTKYDGSFNKLTQKECIPYSGDVYCVEVPSHKIIVKSDGIPVVCGNCHELQSGDIIKAIEQSQSLKPNPKFICITTEGFVNGGWLDQELIRARGILFNEIHDEASVRYLPWLYTQDSEAEIWQGNKTNRLWMKSNPSLGTVKRYDYLEQQIALARGNGTDRAFVLSKDFNVKQSNSEAWLLSEDIEYDSEFDPEEFRGSICLGAVDIAETTDLTCAKILLMKPDDSKKYIFSQYWIPQGKIDRGDLDIKAGARYLDWQKQGIIRITDGNYIDTTVIADWFYELYKTYGFRLYKCGYDVKFSTDFVKRMGDYGFDSELVYQSPTVMSQPMKMVEADIKDKLIVGNREIDKWCFSNVSLQINAQGQGMAVKIDNMSSRKIDGAVATIILYEIYRRYRLDFTNALEN